MIQLTIMETSQIVIERSLYASLLRVALKLNRTVNPEDFQPISSKSQMMQDRAIKALGNKYIGIYGVGNNQSRGIKQVPRITIDLTAYYPGDLGVEQFIIGDIEDNEQYALYEQPFETKDTMFDIHLVANNSQDMRILHQIMYTALPARGYIKPFIESTISEYLNNPGLYKTGNIFLQIGNYYDHNDIDHGLLEKVYTYTCVDGLLDQKLADDNPVSPIKEIHTDISPESSDKVSFTNP